jgi:hypothetical protein
MECFKKEWADFFGVWLGGCVVETGWSIVFEGRIEGFLVFSLLAIFIMLKYFESKFA